MPAGGFEGGIFDVDGVLVDSPHEQAWKGALRDLMEGEWADVRDRSEWSDDRFTPQVYQQAMSGKPRMAGALAGLEYFKVPDAVDRVPVYAAHKQQLLIRLIEDGRFNPYPDALRFVMAVRASGIRVAAASSSKNANLMLRQIRLDTFAEKEGLAYDFLRPGLTLVEIFDADLSGRDFEHGKPDPEIFVTSAGELRVPPEDCFVVEDAVSGVQAAKAGGMTALGVARADDRELLQGANADLVVLSLDEVEVGALASHRLARRPA